MSDELTETREAYYKADIACNEAWKALKFQRVYGKAGEKYRNAWKAYRKANQTYIEAWEAWQAAIAEGRRATLNPQTGK